VKTGSAVRRGEFAIAVLAFDRGLALFAIVTRLKIELGLALGVAGFVAALRVSRRV
jgi:hypothetical protein